LLRMERSCGRRVLVYVLSADKNATGDRESRFTDRDGNLIQVDYKIRPSRAKKVAVVPLLPDISTSFASNRLCKYFAVLCYSFAIMSAYFDQALAQLKTFEGSVPWMYRDSVGKVTVGVGLMLPNVTAACTLPFHVAGAEGATSPATEAQIAAEYARVESLALGKLPSFYRAGNSLELPEAVIDEKLSAVLAGFEATLRTHLAGYDKLPDGVKMALLDMAYNLGPEGLLRGYPQMIRDVESGAWAAAAAQCARGGINAARNAWTRQQMLSAVVETIKAEAEVVERVAGSWLQRLWRGVRRVLRWGGKDCCR